MDGARPRRHARRVLLGVAGLIVGVCIRAGPAEYERRVIAFVDHALLGVR